jgi:hypothetical protein
MEPGERLIEFDIFPANFRTPLVKKIGHRLNALVSDRALYLAAGRHLKWKWRIPFTDIRKVVVEGRLVLVRVYDRPDVYLGVPLGRPRAFTSILQASIPDRVLKTIRLDLTPDGRNGITVTEETGRPGSSYRYYDYVPDEGVDVDSEPLHSLFEARMQQLIRDAHPDAAGSFKRAPE